MLFDNALPLVSGNTNGCSGLVHPCTSRFSFSRPADVFIHEIMDHRTKVGNFGIPARGMNTIGKQDHNQFACGIDPY